MHLLNKSAESRVGRLIARAGGKRQGLPPFCRVGRLIARAGGKRQGLTPSCDDLDTPRVITDANQSIVWRWDNDDAFGGNVANQNPSGLGTFAFNLRFPGQYFDAETGNHYNYFRDYNPETGRYIESDPIGLQGGLNTYGYVGGSPLTRADPLGLLDSPGGGNGGEGPCILMDEFLLTWIYVPFMPRLPVAVMYCYYCCGATSRNECPNPNNCFSRLIPVHNPPYRCPPTSLRPKSKP